MADAGSIPAASIGTIQGVKMTLDQFLLAGILICSIALTWHFCH